MLAALLVKRVQSPVPVAPVAAPSGGVPGFVPDSHGSMGPHRRPGQVFGEPDPLSPFLSSRAAHAPGEKAPESASIAPHIEGFGPFLPDGYTVDRTLSEDEVALLMLMVDELVRARWKI